MCLAGVTAQQFPPDPTEPSAQPLRLDHSRMRPPTEHGSLDFFEPAQGHPQPSAAAGQLNQFLARMDAYPEYGFLTGSEAQATDPAARGITECFDAEVEIEAFDLLNIAGTLGPLQR
jgi:hypothetical protein